MKLLKEEKQLLATVVNIFGSHTEEADVYNVGSSPFMVKDLIAALDTAIKTTWVMSFCVKLKLLRDKLAQGTNL